MSKLKRFIALLAVVLCVLPLFACSAEVECYYSSNEQYFSYEYKVTLSKASIAEIESSANENPALLNGGKWTLKEYFSELAEICGWNVSGQQRQPFVTETATDTTFTFRIVQLQTPDDDSDDDSKLVRTVKKKFYFTTVTYTQPNPLYESLKSYKDGTAQSSTVTFVIKNGYSGLPAFSSAFPTAEGFIDNLSMSFYWKADGINAVNGEEVEVNGERYLKWTVAENNTDITYSYRVPNPVGWYVTVAIVGILVTVIILIVTRKSKSTPKIVDTTEKSRASGIRVYYNPTDAQNIDVFGIDGKEDEARKDLEDIFGFNDDDNGKR